MQAYMQSLQSPKADPDGEASELEQQPMESSMPNAFSVMIQQPGVNVYRLHPRPPTFFFCILFASCIRFGTICNAICQWIRLDFLHIAHW